MTRAEPSAGPAQTVDGFLLSRHWRDSRDGIELILWATTARGPLRVVMRGERAVCFVERDARFGAGDLDATRVERRELALRTLDGKPVDGLYFRNQRDLSAARGLLPDRGVALFESDVKPVERFLMERFITAGFSARGVIVERERFLEMEGPTLRRAEVSPCFRSIAIDVESDGFDGPLYSVAASGPGVDRIFVVSERTVSVPDAEVSAHPDEARALTAFFTWLAEHDPDLVLGWNVVGFDLDYLERRCEVARVPFAIGRGGERATVLQPGQAGGVRVARVPGRAVLDGIELLRAGFWSFESFDLENVAQTLLGRGKRIHTVSDRLEEIRRLYREDREALLAYNIEDCRLVNDIFAHADLERFATRRAELTGLAMDRLGGSVAAFDHLYLPRLHRKGRVARDVGGAESGPGSPGGYVMDSIPGLYRNVLLLDFKSLYPSIIRTFRIDPWGLAEPGADPVPGFGGAAFARDGAILPELVAELWSARDRAKAASDAPLSQAIKILMNSLYGVLGAYGCRFHDWRLASSITRRGHEIIQRSRDHLEAQGRQVIYGDTDSLFVLLGPDWSLATAQAEGERLADLLNASWDHLIPAEFGVQSHLEIEFETHYSRFLMPTIRGEQTGSKKRYAGLVGEPGGAGHLVFKGLESVRTDWTPLARRFQRELYRRVFNDEPWESFLGETLDDLLAGRLDEELVYRKRLRRGIDEYTRNVPPHVQAARKLERPTRWVRYVITASGPEPVVDAIPRPDYAHYRERQLAPAADGLLHFLGTTFDTVTDAQISMF